LAAEKIAIAGKLLPLFALFFALLAIEELILRRVSEGRRLMKGHEWPVGLHHRNDRGRTNAE
jgi:hypothetical protein